MGRLDWSWGESVSAPVLTMNQQHPPQNLDMDSLISNNAASFAQPTASLPQPSGAQWQLHNPIPIKNVRKRSRDEMGWDEDESSRSTTAPFPSARQTPSPSKERPSMGSGMTLSYGDASVRDATSQTGTWAEELAEKLRSSDLERDEQARPTLEARKSIRLDTAEAGMDGMARSTLRRESKVQDPVIDEATMALGIGWSTISRSDTMSQAARGWARYIETHFPLQSVTILWKNTSLPAFLVSAVTTDGRSRVSSPLSPTQRSASPWQRPVGSPGYFLFDEALQQGKLVAKSWERTLENLRSTPMLFEGDRVLEADADEAQRHSESNNFQHWAGWRASSDEKKAPADIVVQSVEPAGEGMEVD